MKAETDPLYPDKTGSSNTDDNNDNGESSCQEDETSKLLGDSETKVQAEIRPVQNHSARLPVASDTDGLMIPLIKYQRPALARSVSGGNGSVPAKKKHGGKNNQALPNGTLNVLAAQTLKIASINGLGEVDKLENDLEDEIRYENRSPAKTAIGRLRRAGQHRIHSKVVLLVVVFLNIIDCLLVISELLLDFLHVLFDREEVRDMVSEFIDQMSKLHHKLGWEKKYEYGPHGSDRTYTSYHFLEYILNAFVTFKPDASAAAHRNRSEECVYFLNLTAVNASQSLTSFVTSTASQMGPDWSDTSSVAYGACFAPFLSAKGSSSSAHSSLTDHDSSPGFKLKHHGYVGHKLLDVAHKLHYASVAILSVLVLLLIFKIFCSGKRFFRSRMQVFDGVVVLISFTLDLVFIEGLAVLRLEEFIIIICFLLPWRILRVINSLIAAVLDQQRLNLKIIYKQKKKISRTLSETNTKIEVMQRHIEVLQALCTSRGLSVVNGEITGTRHSAKPSGKDNSSSHKHGGGGSSNKHGGGGSSNKHGSSSGGLAGMAGMMALGKLAFQAADTLAPISNGYTQHQHNNNNNNINNGGVGSGDSTTSQKSSLPNGHAGTALSTSDDVLNRGEHPSHELGTELTPVGHIKAESDSELFTLENELQQEQHQRQGSDSKDVESGIEGDASARQSATTISIYSENDSPTTQPRLSLEDTPSSPSQQAAEIIASPGTLEADLDSVRVQIGVANHPAPSSSSSPPPSSPESGPLQSPRPDAVTSTNTADATAPTGSPTTPSLFTVDKDTNSTVEAPHENISDTDAVSKL